jgi:hypothetical protein
MPAQARRGWLSVSWKACWLAVLQRRAGARPPAGRQPPAGGPGPAAPGRGLEWSPGFGRVHRAGESLAQAVRTSSWAGALTLAWPFAEGEPLANRQIGVDPRGRGEGVGGL